MTTARWLFGLVLGRRRPWTHGVDTVAGIERPVRIRRDRWHVPHVTAETDADAYYGLGFCQGQDRTFQIETTKRAATGTLSELVGASGVDVDRLTRRLGLTHRAAAQLDDLRPDLRRRVEAFAAGVTDGATRGLTALPHEFTLLRAEPTPHRAVDVVATMKLHAFLLAANWQDELMRLRVLVEDGEEALRAVDPGPAAHLPATTPVGQAYGRALDRLTEDLGHLAAQVPLAGASNAWAVAGSRTVSGRPIVANDPHLPPSLPAPWYLAHLTTPAWSLAGAAFAGTPGIAAGHNGHVAWGVSAGVTDDTDLFLEEVAPDGRSVRGPDGPVAGEVRREVIRVKGGDDVIEEVLETPRGPLVGRALADVSDVAAPGGGEVALSLRGVWLDGGPVRGLLDVADATTVAALHERFADWPGLTLNLVAADTAGAIGWQLVGELPVRRTGTGVVPLPGWLPDAGWAPSRLPFGAMPSVTDPEPGFVAAANNAPVAGGDHPFVGSDFLDGYRAAAIVEALEARHDWDLAATAALQRDTRCLPWRDIRDHVLAVTVEEGAAGEDARLALDLLRRWDGRVDADSAAAAVYELLLASLIRRVARAAAPRSASAVLGASIVPRLLPYSIVGLRRTAHVVDLVRTQPEGWFASGWDAVIADALASAVADLHAQRGPDPTAWRWGEVRTVTFRHTISNAVRRLAAIFDRGPFPSAGDTSTIPQASVPPLEPTADPVGVANLRMTVDVGRWSDARWVLAGGQSGNPISPHYDDQLALWHHGGGIPIAWTEEEVAAATRDDLRLVPHAPVRRPAMGPVR